jgi:hypothetical protein
MPGKPPDARFADYLAGRLTSAEARAFEAGMDGDDRSAADTWQRLGDLPEERPSPTVHRRFHEMLLAETRPRFQWKQWAAAAALFAGGVVAGRFLPVERVAGGDVVDLRQEVRSLRETVILSMLTQQSATDRLKGVITSTTLNRPDTEVVAALIQTVRADPNVNVRLAAIDALKRFGSDQRVRAGFVESLSSTESPLVQIALIDVLAELRERQAAPALKELETATRVDSIVKQRARLALERLQQ